MLIAENLSAIAAMQHEIEALSEDKQQELALLIRDFISRATQAQTPSVHD